MAEPRTIGNTERPNVAALFSAEIEITRVSSTAGDGDDGHNHTQGQLT